MSTQPYTVGILDRENSGDFEWYVVQTENEYEAVLEGIRKNWGVQTNTGELISRAEAALRAGEGDGFAEWSWDFVVLLGDCKPRSWSILSEHCPLRRRRQLQKKLEALRKSAEGLNAIIAPLEQCEIPVPDSWQAFRDSVEDVRDGLSRAISSLDMEIDELQVQHRQEQAAAEVAVKAKLEENKKDPIASNRVLDRG